MGTIHFYENSTCDHWTAASIKETIANVNAKAHYESTLWQLSSSPVFRAIKMLVSQKSYVA